MEPLHLLAVALVQGITEFLPVSSSGHLALIHRAAGWPDQGLAVDVAAHAGSLVAVVFWLRRDVAALAGAAAAAAFGRAHEGRRLLGHLLAASVPACAAGAALSAWSGDGLRGLETIAWTTTLGAVLLYAADRFAPARRRLAAMTLRDALLVGCAQALALVPGTSRAGITVTAARALGYARLDAARFSMLLSIPVILGAGALQAFELAAADGDPGRWRDLALVAALSAVAAFAAVSLLMRWLARASFAPFVVYRLALGLVLLGAAYL